MVIMGLGLATVMASAVAITTTLAQEPYAIYVAALACALIGLGVTSLVFDRRIVRQYATFGMNRVTAREVLGLVGAKRWKKRDPRVTLEFRNWYWSPQKTSDEFERELEKYRSRLGKPWTHVAMAIVRELNGFGHEGSPLLGPDDYLALLDDVVAQRIDPAMLEDFVLTFGAQTGMQAALLDVPLDYARTLYPDRVLHPSDRRYLTRYQEVGV